MWRLEPPALRREKILTYSCNPRTLAGTRQSQNAGKRKRDFEYSLAGSGRGKSALCMPAFGSALLTGAAACGHIGHCLKTLGTQEQALLLPVSISVAQGSFSVPGQPCFLSSPVANSWHLFLGLCRQLSI